MALLSRCPPPIVFDEGNRRPANPCQQREARLRQPLDGPGNPQIIDKLSLPTYYHLIQNVTAGRALIVSRNSGKLFAKQLEGSQQLATVCVAGIEMPENELLRVYPKQGEKGFYEKAARAWVGLANDEGPAFWLFSHIKPRRNKIDRFNAFVLYLALCLKRPWERNGGGSWSAFSSISGNDDLLWQITSILERVSDDFPDLPDSQFLKRHSKKSAFKESVAEVTLGALPFQTGAAIQKLLAPQISKVESKKIGVAIRLARRIKEGRVKKRDLLREFSGDKKQVGLLLERWEKAGSIKQEKFIGGATWVSRARLSENNLTCR
ncbi:MAG: hypothetical protein SCM96_02325 [Acidobacteriota bacterium]|nr:hypothetical protein [Acidobacteriota bacterium]